MVSIQGYFCFCARKRSFLGKEALKNKGEKHVLDVIMKEIEKTASHIIKNKGEKNVLDIIKKEIEKTAPHIIKNKGENNVLDKIQDTYVGKFIIATITLNIQTIYDWNRGAITTEKAKEDAIVNMGIAAGMIIGGAVGSHVGPHVAGVGAAIGSCVGHYFGNMISSSIFELSNKQANNIN